MLNQIKKGCMDGMKKKEINEEVMEKAVAEVVTIDSEAKEVVEVAEAVVSSEEKGIKDSVKSSAKSSDEEKKMAKVAKALAKAVDSVKLNYGHVEELVQNYYVRQAKGKRLTDKSIDTAIDRQIKALERLRTSLKG